MAAFLLHARPEIMAGCILALALIGWAIRRYNRLYGPPPGYEPYYDAWRCKHCSAIIQDAWDLEKHQLTHEPWP